MPPRGSHRGRGSGKLPPKKRNQTRGNSHHIGSSSRSGSTNNNASSGKSTSSKKNSGKTSVIESSGLVGLLNKLVSSNSELSDVDTSNLSPSNTIFQILSELQLSFNPSLGTLEGSNLIDGVSSKGSINKKILTNTKKSLEKLINEIKISILTDEEIIKKLETDIKAIDGGTSASKSTGPGRRGRGSNKITSPLKRKHNEIDDSEVDSKMDDGDDDEEEKDTDKVKAEEEYLPKGKKKGEDEEESKDKPKIKVKMKFKRKDDEEDESSKDDEDEDNDSDDHQKNDKNTSGIDAEEEEEEDDDDDTEVKVRPGRKRRRKIITVANGKRREINIKQEENEAAEDEEDSDEANEEERDEEQEKDDNKDEEKGAGGDKDREDGDEAQDSDLDESETVKKEGTSTREDDSDKIGRGKSDIVPSVYANHEDPNFDIDAMLEPARKSLHLYGKDPEPEPISCPQDIKSSEEEERLKAKYAVAYFPHHDLKDLLPGVIPDKDFSSNKPTNQIAFNSFQTYVEPFFRPFTDEDIKLLRTKINLSSNIPKNYDHKVTPFIIPKLGPYYADVWHEEDIKAGFIPSEEKPFDSLKELEYYAKLKIQPRGTGEEVTNDVLETETVSCGPLASRLLSALLKDETGDDDGTDSNSENKRFDDLAGSPTEEDKDDELATTNAPAAASSNTGNTLADTISQLSSSSALADQQGWKSSIVKADYETLDERLKRELKYIGVYMNVEQTLNEAQRKLNGSSGNGLDGNGITKFDEDWVTGREDDEVSSELRILQRQLKDVTLNNQKRKKLLVPIVEEQIAWQEYMSVLEDLDKQVEQSYRRRISVTPKKAKKKSANSSHGNGKEELSAHQVAANSGFRALLDKRLKWIEKIGPLFRPNIEMRRIPKESVFNNLDNVENEGGLVGNGDDDEDENNQEEDQLEGLSNRNNDAETLPQSLG